MASSTSAYVRERANRSPSDSSVPRTSTLVRTAWTPTSRAGTTMSEKPRSSLRWRVTGRSFVSGSSGASPNRVRLRERAENLSQDIQCPVDRPWIVRQRHEIVRRALEQQSPRGTTPRHLARNTLAGVVQEAHLRDTAHAG